MNSDARSGLAAPPREQVAMLGSGGLAVKPRTLGEIWIQSTPSNNFSSAVMTFPDRAPRGRFIFMLCVVAAGLASCSRQETTTAEPPPRPVKTFMVQAVDGERTFSFPAVIEAGRSAELTFQVPGTITALDVIEGQVVAEGQLLASLDERDARNRLVQAEVEFARTDAEYERAARLAEADAISRSVLETRRSQRDVAQAALDSARKALDDTALRAPFDGMISRVFAREFQNVQAKEPITNIVGDELEAVINVPSLMVVQSPRFTRFGARISMDSLPGVVLPATLTETALEADPNTATYDVSFSFEAPPEALVLPGMTATLTGSMIDALPESTGNSLVIPLLAILSDHDGEFVWRMDPATGTVVRAPVRLGQELGGGNIELLEGLRAGDQIVAAGASYLSAGQRVRPWTPD